MHVGDVMHTEQVFFFPFFDVFVSPQEVDREILKPGLTMHCM